MRIKTLDKYVLGSLVQSFIFGIVVFASILLASEAFLDIIRQISKFGIPFNVALLVVALRLPGIIVYTIPMALLVSVILTYNRLNTNLEITAIRSSGISLYRLSVPALICGLLACVLTLSLNEVIVPKANYQARNIVLWAITQKNLPKQKQNFVYKELGKQNSLRRLFYIEKYAKKKMYGVVVIDLSQGNTTKIIKAEEVENNPDQWIFNRGRLYTVSNDGRITNTSSFETIVLENTTTLDLQRKDPRSKEHNFFELAKIIQKASSKAEKIPTSLLIKWHEKISIPFSCLLVVIIGVPLAISPPRARINRGLGFGVIVIFIYYLLRALSMSLGEINLLTPLLAAWLPNIIILVLGFYLLQKKNYC